MSEHQKIHTLFTHHSLYARWEPVSGLGLLFPFHPSNSDHLRFIREGEIAQNLSRPKKLRRLLAALPAPLSVEWARLCCYRALFYPSPALAMLLRRCPPASRLFYTNTGADLVYLAAMLGLRKHLELFLAHGADPTQYRAGIPPLAAAAICGQDHCVRVLLDALSPEQVLTPALVEVWSLLGTGSHTLDHCIRLIARRLPGLSGDDPFPIPPGMTLIHGVRNGNPRLLEALCRKSPPSHREAGEAARSLYTHSPHLPQQLGLLLTTAPSLLRHPRVRSLLVFAALSPDRGVPEEVFPWVTRLQGSIRLCGGNDTIPLLSALSARGLPWTEILDRWKQRLPSQLRPTLDRRFIPSGFPLPTEAEFDTLLAGCRLVGPEPKQGPSPLAQGVLALGSPHLVARELEPGGLLDCDPLPLLELCRCWDNRPQDVEVEPLFHAFRTPMYIRRSRVKRALLSAISRTAPPEYQF